MAFPARRTIVSMLLGMVALPFSLWQHHGDERCPEAGREPDLDVT